jgi:hypothetical protein
VLAIPPVDWTRNRVVLVSAGPRSSTGYRLRVVSVVKERDRVLVTLRERTPSLGEPVQARVTYPYRLITIPAGGDAVTVHWQGRP